MNFCILHNAKIMKKVIILLGLASAMSAFTGCSKDDVTETEQGIKNKDKQDITLIATLAEDEETRTAMGDKSAVWSAGDRIALYADVSSSEHYLPFEVSAGAVGTATAGFTLDESYRAGWDEEIYVPKKPFGFGAFAAVFPHANAHFYSSSSVVRLGASIPPVQAYVEGSFDKLSVPMIASCEEKKVSGGMYTYTTKTFKYLSGLIHLTMTATDATEIEKIELSGNALTGKAVVEFSTVEAMDDAFKATLQGGAGSLGMIGLKSFRTDGGTGKTVTMNGPIALSATPVNAYFSVLPADYSGKTLKFTFFQSDGIKTEKSLAGHALNAGEIAQLPSFAYHIPFVPVASVAEKTENEGTHLVATCTQDESVEQYTAQILHNGGVLRSFVLDPAKGVDLNTVQITGMIPGEYTFQFVVKTDFKDKSGVDAAYSEPVDYQYNVAPTVPLFTYDMNARMLHFVNFQSYWKRIDYALLKKKDAGKEDFANIPFTTGDGLFVWLDVDNAPTEAGDYTYAVRVWHDTSDAANGYAEGYDTFTLAGATLPSVELLDEVVGYGDLTIGNWAKIKAGLSQIEYLEVCWIKGETTDFNNPEKTIYSYTDSNYFEDAGESYFIHIKDAIGADSGTYSALVKIWYDSSDPDGYISASKSFSLSR